MRRPILVVGRFVGWVFILVGGFVIGASASSWFSSSYGRFDSFETRWFSMRGYLLDLLPYDLLLPAGIFILWLVRLTARQSNIDLAVFSWKGALVNGLGFGGVALFGYGLGCVWPPPPDDSWYQLVALVVVGFLLVIGAIWLAWHWRSKPDQVCEGHRLDDSSE